MGLANNITDPLVKVFSRVFTMTTFQSSLVQFAFYGAYFCLAIVLCGVIIGLPGIIGVAALIGVSACMSLMFPTIYGIALHGLGDDTKLGGAGLVMAILGGALFPLLPLLQGAMVDAFGAAVSYSVPLVCFVIVAAYGFFDMHVERKHHWV